MCICAHRAASLLYHHARKVHMSGREACREPPQLIKGTLVAKKASSDLSLALQRQAGSQRQLANSMHSLIL